MKFRISVPATTANIGPGFDTAGIALSLYNVFTFDFSVNTGITFFDQHHHFDKSLPLQTFFDVLTQYHIEHPKHVHLETQSNIPIARGLGSSSTCIVAGVMAANQYASLNLTKQEIARIASQYEGHPDNVTPAIMGNMCLCVMNENALLVHDFTVHASLSFVAIYPDKPVSTQTARAILPTALPYSDIVYSLSRASLLSYGFTTGDTSILKTILSDKLHEPYRKTLIEHYDLIQQALNPASYIGLWISGSGPTMIVLTQDPQGVIHQLSAVLPKTNTIQELHIDTQGASYEPFTLGHI